MKGAMDYQKQANELLAKFGVTFQATLIGSDCPPFCEDAKHGREMDKVDVYPRKSHVHGNHYRCTFTRTNAVRPTCCYKHGNQLGYDDHGWCLAQFEASLPAPPKPTLIVDFWNSYADAEFNRGRKNKRTPTPYDLLACMQKSEVGTFDQFCSDFGYDTDSRQAERIYHAVCEEWRKVQAFFTVEEIEQLREVN